MCTVTVIPIPTGFRVACNRDESPARAAALPPLLNWADGVRAMMPIDPVGGGTWIAASDRGLVFALLNYNPAAPDVDDGRHGRVPPASRGAIIPMLADCRDFLEAESRVADLRPARFNPFRLLIVGAAGHAEFVSDGRRIVRRDAGVRSPLPLLLTSSGLGDAIAEPPRRALFESLLATGSSPDRQDEFHRHSWPERRHLSVCMSRDGARTVSYTTVEITATCAVMTYWPKPPDAIDETSPAVRRIALVGRAGLIIPAGCA
jgi:hypothetical protein